MCIADISTVVILHYPSATHEPSSATGPVSHHLLTPVFCHTSDGLHSSITSSHPDARVHKQLCPLTAQTEIPKISPPG